jgi:hypothetical protein
MHLHRSLNPPDNYTFTSLTFKSPLLEDEVKSWPLIQKLKIKKYEEIWFYGFKSPLFSLQWNESFFLVAFMQCNCCVEPTYFKLFYSLIFMSKIYI